MARVVAEKLAEISRAHQVICVTHTAQIAAMGAQHFYISKSVEEGITHTSVEELSTEERVREIERLVGGDMSVHGREHARDLLRYSAEYREQLEKTR